MPEVTLTRTIDAPVNAVWAAWDDYADISLFNPALTRSFLLDGSPATGLGAERQCDFKDGKNHIRERIVTYRPGEQLTLDVYEGTLPLKEAQADIRLRALKPDRTELRFTMRFTPKMGLLGRVMAPMMKSQFRRALGQLVDGNKAFVERGHQGLQAA